MEKDGHEIVFVNQISVSEQISKLLCFLKKEEYVRDDVLTHHSAQKRKELMQAIALLESSNLWKRGMSEVEVNAFLLCFLSVLDGITDNKDDNPVLYEAFAKNLVECSADSQQYFCVRLQTLCTLFCLLSAKNHSSSISVLQQIINLCLKRSTTPAHSLKFEKMMMWVGRWLGEGKDVFELVKSMELMYRSGGERREALVCQMKLVQMAPVAGQKKLGTKGEEAIRAILQAIAHPDVYIFEELVSMDAIKRLEGEQVFEFLSIFAYGTLAQYDAFYERMKQNEGFMKAFEENGLTDEACRNKMKILTFVQLCENNSDISFNVLLQALNLESEDQIEPLVLKAIKAELVECVIDAADNKVVVRSTVQRVFRLNNWQSALEKIRIWQGLPQLAQSTNEVI